MKLLSLKSLIIISLAFSVCLSFLNCSGGGSSSPTDEQVVRDPNSDGADKRILFKQIIVNLLAGDYTGSCTKTIGNASQGPNSGSPMLVNTNGEVGWGFGSINILTQLSNEFSLVVSHVDYLTASKFDIINSNQDTLAVLGISVPVQGGTSNVTVTDRRTSPELGNLCASLKIPNAVQADIWKQVSLYTSYPSQKLSCFDLSTFKKFTWDFTFSSDSIILGAYKLTNLAPRRLELLSVVDLEPNEGISYQITDSNSVQIQIRMKPDLSLADVQMIKANGNIISCGQ